MYSFDFLDDPTADLTTRKAQLEARRKALLAQAASARATAAPTGTMVGGIYVAPSIWQNLNAAIQSPLAAWQSNALDEEEARLSREEAEAVRALMARMPKATVSGGEVIGSIEEPLTEGVRMPSTTTQPTLNDKLAWAASGMGIPSMRDTLTKFTNDQLINEPDRQAARADKRELQELTLAQNKELRLAQLQQTAQYQQAMMQNAALSIEQRREAAQQHDATLRAIAAMNSADRRYGIDTRAATAADREASRPEKPLPVHAQKQQSALMNLDSGLKAYSDLLSQYDPRGAGNGSTSPVDRARIGTAFTDLQMRMKEAYELGAITGPDMRVLESALSDPTSITGTIKGAAFGKKPFEAQIDEVGKVLGRLRGNFEAQYGRTIPQAAGVAAPAPTRVPAQSTGPVQVRSIEEARALPPGTVFIDPNGVRRVR